MKKFLQNKRLLTIIGSIFLILLIIGGSVSLRNRKNTPSFITVMGNDIVSWGARAVDWPFRLMTDGVNNISDLTNAENENNYLKKQVDDLAQTKARNSSLESENKQLKSAVKLQDTLTSYDVVNASVISRAPDTWSDLLVIDKGTNSGIAKNMAVMCEGGVIGRILQVSRTSAKVELITTTDQSANRFAVQADAKGGDKVHGIITVNNNTNGLAFTQVVDSKKLKKGTRVYTSGMGGRSPKGLLIGTVAQTTKDTFGLSDLIEIKPAGNLNDPSVVSVIERKVEN